MKSEIKLFKEWVDYLGNICDVDDCGYSLVEATTFIDSCKHYKDEENKVDLIHFVWKLENIYNYWNVEFTPWKQFRRKRIIENLEL